MPLYNFKCPSCGLEKKRILDPQEADNGGNCKCGEKLQRVVMTEVSSSSKEIVDNGIMVKAVTRFVDTEDVYGQLKVAEKNMRRLDTV